MRQALINLKYQPLIYEPPVTPGALFRQACSNDETTIDFWQHTWLGNMTANKSTYGSFCKQSIASEYNKYQYMPIIIAGSGPSLKVNAHELKNRGGIPLVSCLHNFHYFEDLDLAPEYYVTLDAGPVTIEEVTEGGTKTEEEYWARTADRTLIAFVSTDPKLLEKWRGKILFYNAVIPRPDFRQKADAIEVFNATMSSGGNVLGACLYFAKAILGGSQIIFVGADFSFGYDEKFHAWNSKYDVTMGATQRVTDIYGIKVDTWPSYYGFKSYFDSTALRLPGIYYNCTEGGCLGAYPDGNLACFKYLNLSDCLKLLHINKELSDQMENPGITEKKILYP